MLDGLSGKPVVLNLDNYVDYKKQVSMIRLATENDLGAIISMAFRFHQASPYQGTQIDFEKVVEALRSYIVGNLREKVVLLLVDFLDHPRGILVGQVTDTLFGYDRQAIELMWWVDEDYRGKESLKLIEAYEDWALRVGAKIVHLALLNTKHKEKLEKLYSRKGYVETETSFVKYLGV